MTTRFRHVLAQLHPEDVKSELRKRFGTLANFERTTGLPERSVSDLLRGKSSARVEAAIGKAIGLSEVSDDLDPASELAVPQSLIPETK